MLHLLREIRKICRSNFVLFLTCVVIVGSCSGTTRTGGPKLIFSSDVLDLGNGLPGEELTGTLDVCNEGNSPLQITKLEASCGCSSVNISDPLILPGRRALLTITTRIKADAPLTRFRVSLFSNDLVCPMTVCTVQAETGPPILRTEPGYVDFGEIPLGTSATRRLRLLRPDGTFCPPHDSVHVELKWGKVAAMVEPEANSSSEPGLFVVLRPSDELPLGPFEDTLEIRPIASSRCIQVRVYGQMVPRFTVAPNTVYFGDIDFQGKPLLRSIVVRRTDGHSNVRVIKTAVPAVLKLTPTEGSDTGSPLKRFNLILDPKALTEEFRETQVRIWVDEEPQPLIIHVKATWKKKPN